MTKSPGRKEPQPAEQAGFFSEQTPSRADLAASTETAHYHGHRDRLRARFQEAGADAGVFGAQPALLQEVKGIGEAVALDLKLIAAVAHRTLKSDLRGKKVLASWSSVIEYCHAAMAHENREQFRILFLDKRNALIVDEVQQTGTVDHTPVYPREVVKRALELPLPP